LSFLGLLLLQGLLAFLIPGVIAGGVIGGCVYLMAQASVGVGVSVLLGFVIFLVAAAALGVMVWLGLGYCMGMAVSVVEKKPAWESLQRASQLSQGSRGRIFVLFLLLMALAMVVSMVAYIPLLMVIGGITAMGPNSHAALVALVAAQVIYYVVNLSLQIALQPVPWIALVLFYYDQRIRKEGFDIERLMEQAGMTQPPAPVSSSAILGLATETGGGISAKISDAGTPPDTVGEP
jgi:hypothetical protein